MPNNGRACGIDVQDEGVIEVDAVISATSGMHTSGSLLSERDVPEKMAKKARQAILSHKGFVLQLGLSNRIDASSYSNYVLPFLCDQHQLFLPDQCKLRWPSHSHP